MLHRMTQYKSDILNTLSERGFLNQATDMEGLDAAFAAGPVTAYIGYDPTADSLHIGHLITIMMLYWLQQAGHKPITLMGGVTALIGDPSFKDASRPLLSEELVQTNIAGIKQVFGDLLRYGDRKSDALMVNNADWLRGLNYIDFLRDYGPLFSVNRMLSFDSVKNRIEREQHLSFLEFNYSILQAYDFVELHRRYGCTLQLSGADQWANAIQGVELGRKKDNVQLYALTTPLLTDANGKKMGKSEGNALWLNRNLQSDYEYYQYWRNVDDGMVGKMLRLFTTLPIAEVAKLETLQGAEINEAKKILAFHATKIMRGEDAAREAERTAQETFAGGGRSGGLPKIAMPQGMDSVSVVDLLILAEMAASKAEARRLIKGNGVRVNDEQVSDEAATVGAGDFENDGALKLSAGKKRHVLVTKY